ncbi:hypothetical protein ACFQ21_10595 [Ohtaekwangia kribbensis]|uniref:Uncharacterized protein n=1 Tax=Ohtaekwangia kribbensis TaxID=688913 RepID=A0ABW3K0I7_9BACT
MIPSVKPILAKLAGTDFLGIRKDCNNHSGANG